MSDELVDNPEHYGGRDHPYEAIKVIEAMGWGEGFCMGSIVKYLLREGKKDGEPAVRDLAKLAWYANRRIYEIENGIDGRMDAEEARRILKDILGMGGNESSGKEGLLDLQNLVGDMLNDVFPESITVNTARMNENGCDVSIPERTVPEARNDDARMEHKDRFIGMDRKEYIECLDRICPPLAPQVPNLVVIYSGDEYGIAYEDLDLTFGDVLRFMKANPSSRFARKGWNGKGIFIQLQNPDEGSKNTLPYIYIDTRYLVTDNPDAPKGRVPWLASQTDMLAEDWHEIFIIEYDR